jgi:uncharacterized protein
MSITSVAAKAILLALGLGWLPAAGGPMGAPGSPDRAVDGPHPSSGLTPVELATVGVDATEGVPMVLLREPLSGRILPILVGLPEAQSILGVMLGLETPRPMTHDLLASVIQGLGATVEEVLVHDMRGTTYIGTVRLRLGGEGEVRDIDSRPSDALALAVRTDAPILVSEGLLMESPPFDLMVPEAGEQVVRILGATVVAPTPTLRDRYQLPRRAGVVVVGVSGEAAEQGIRRGDLIVEVNGQRLRQPLDFLEAARASGEEPVRVKYWREGEEQEVELRPQALPGAGPRRAPGIRV